MREIARGAAWSLLSVLVSACGKRSHGAAVPGRDGAPQSPAGTVSAASPAVSPPRASAATSAPSATAPTTELPDELAHACAALQGGVSFSECNDPPRTADYPDCRQFTLSAPDATSPGGCPPKSALLSITGYPGIAFSFELAVSASKPPYRYRLRLERALPPAPAGLATGTEMGTVSVMAGLRAQLLPGPGLKRFTNKLSLLEEP